jgi:hypothetical protein
MMHDLQDEFKLAQSKTNKKYIMFADWVYTQLPL